MTNRRASETFYPLYVEVSEICIHSDYSHEPYGEWSESSLCRVEGAYTKDRPNCEEIPVGFIPQSGRTVYVVTQSWGNGDSFGRRDGLLRIIGVFADQQFAENVERIIESAYESYHMSTDRDSARYVDYKDEAGNSCRYDLNVSYFDDVYSISVDKIKVA